MRARIKKLPNRKLNWDSEFLRDMKRHEGKIVTLYDYRDIEGHSAFTLKTDDDADWHSHGIWTFHDNDDTFRQLFLTNYELVELPEDLFKL